MKKRILHNWGLKLISLLIAIALWFIIVEFADPQESRTFSNIQVKFINTDVLEQQNKAYEVLDNTDVVRVTVRAPGSVISQLRASDIVAEADMSKLTEINTVGINYSIQNVDIEVDESSITGNRDAVKLNVENRDSKWIKVQNSVVGDVAEGYIISGITQEQTTIEISGPESAVDRVSYAVVELDVTGASRDVSANVETMLYDADGNLLNLPSVVRNGDTEYMNIYVEILATKEVPVEVVTKGEPAQGYLATGVVECDTQTVLLAGKSLTLSNVNRITIPADRLDITGRTSSLIQTVNIKDYLPANTKLADSEFNGRVTTTVYVEPIMDRTLLLTRNDIIVSNIPEGYEMDFVEGELPCELVISGLNEVINAVQMSSVQATVDIEAWLTEQEKELLSYGTYDVPVKVKVEGDVEYTEELMIRLLIFEKKEEVEEEKKNG